MVIIFINLVGNTFFGGCQDRQGVMPSPGGGWRERFIGVVRGEGNGEKV